MIQHTFRSAKSNSSQVEFKSLKEASSEKERVSPFTSSQKELLSTEQHFSKPVIKTVLDKLEVGETITVEVSILVDYIINTILSSINNYPCSTF